jgi:hypothetical protein
MVVCEQQQLRKKDAVEEMTRVWVVAYTWLEQGVPQTMIRAFDTETEARAFATSTATAEASDSVFVGPMDTVKAPSIGGEVLPIAPALGDEPAQL